VLGGLAFFAAHFERRDGRAVLSQRNDSAAQRAKDAKKSEPENDLAAQIESIFRSMCRRLFSIR
jgi:hypothetical protein